MIVPIGKDEIWKIQKVAHRTWPETFKDILSDAQLYYMLDMMYSTSSLKNQMENNVLFFSYEGQYEAFGFIGFEIIENKTSKELKIHKLYVNPIYHNKSIGKSLVLFAISFAKKEDISTITLNVNRFNAAVGFYKHMGFNIVKTEDIDIGNNYLMEDYVMHLTL